jgi:hypothetical protein
MMIKKICLGLSLLSVATSIATAAYFIYCKKKNENKVNQQNTSKA